MTSATWTAIRRRMPLWVPLLVYRWICTRQWRAIEREREMGRVRA